MVLGVCIDISSFLLPFYFTFVYYYGLMPRKVTGPSFLEQALEVLDSEECKADFEKLGPLKAFVPKLLILKQGKRSYVLTDADKLRAKLKEKGIISYAPSK